MMRLERFQQDEEMIALLSKLAGPLMKVAVQITKNVLVPLRLTAVMSAIDETT